jgi:hypothetical protein
MINEIFLKNFSILSELRGGFGGAEGGQAAAEQFLEIVNGLDCGFELAGQVEGFLESGAIAGEELFEAAFAAQEGVKARFEEFTFEVAFVRDEVFERGGVRCDQRVDQPDGFAVVGEDQGKAGLVASNEVLFKMVKAIDVLTDAVLDGFGEFLHVSGSSGDVNQ